MTAIEALRRQQEEDSELGAFFKALNTFSDRTLSEYFCEDMPFPAIALDRIRTGCRGEFREKDGLGLLYRITLDPTQIGDGLEAAEVLTHELVHLWQAVIGRLPEGNLHNGEFLQCLQQMGIEAEGVDGRHRRTTSVWTEWMKRNEDLELDSFLLPGAAERALPELHFECNECGFSFRTRRTDANVVCMTEDCGIPMELVAE